MQLLCQDADPIFFPNKRELLCILEVLPIGSAEAERSFSCLRQIHSWLRSTMSNERLGNLGVLACQGFDIQLSVDQICQSFAQNIIEECVVNLYCIIRLISYN